MAFLTSSPNKLLSITIAFMAVGTTSELLLIGHYEDTWQLVPILLIGTSLVVFLIRNFGQAEALKNIFTVLMLACAISGFLGIWFHLNANMEFAREMRPTASSWAIFVKSISGAIPALAPGTMVVFGLIGYIHSLSTLKEHK